MKTRIPIIIILVTIIGFVLGMVMPVQAATDLPIYTNSLASSWEDWSYGGLASNYANANPVHGGTNSIAVTYTSGWSGLQIGYHGANLDVSAYDTFRFWIHGGSTGGQNILLQIGGLEQTITPQANTWTRVDMSLLPLGSPRTVYSITWFNNTSGSQAKFYLDDIAFVDSGATPPPTTPPGISPALSVNATSGQHPISPNIYGMNFASEAIATDLRLPVRRWGGNSTSRYNWQNGFTNTGSDWYYENVPGNNADDFIAQDRRTGTKTIMTMPLIGWISKNSPSSHPYACGFKISKYGNQQDADWQWDTDCGNGNHTNGTPITGNDPLDTSVATTASYATGWVNHLITTFGTAANGGVMFYNLDNEPMLWNSTHRDIHPNATTYDEMRDRTWAYAAAIKSADPTAKTLGPVVWGWCAYFYSAADGCGPGADRQAHGNTDFVEWYLQQMHAYEQQHGTRILDYLDVHIYPQIDGVYSDNLGSADVQAKRLRSTRQLWDTTYVHEGWIGQPVYLIPRMKQWVANDYPGTKLAITEYNWGALGFMNGALAQADLLGIFGREGLNLATLWGPPTDGNAPGIFAFRMYRNYDGQGSAFGETSVQGASADQDKLAIYSAQRSQDGSLTLMIINKTGQGLTSSLTLTNFQPGTAAKVYRYSSANLTAIVHEPDQAVTTGGFSATFPANSITLIVVPAATTPPVKFTFSGNAGLAGAVLLYTDVTAKIGTADGSGLYTITVPYGWSGSVTPSKTGYAFNPASRTYTNVTTNQTNQDYALTIPDGWAGGVSITSDRALVAVGRPHVGSEVMTYNGFGSGSTTSYVPMLFKNAWGAYNAALYIQNTDIANSASATIKYYDANGNLTCSVPDTISPLVIQGYWVPDISCLPDGWVGGAVITANRNIVAVGRPHIGSQVTSYDGFGSGSGSMYVPMLFKNAWGSYNAALYIQNTDAASVTTFDIKYYDANGNLTCSVINESLNPLASRGYWIPGVSCLPDGWAGGAVVTANKNIVAIGRPHVGEQITSYNGLPAGRTSLRVPMLFKTAFGGSYNAALYLQNTDTLNSATVTIDYYDSNGNLVCSVPDTLPKLATKGYWLPDVTCLPAGWAGAAVVTANKNLVAVARPHVGAEVATYGVVSTGSTNIYLPMLFKNAWGSYDSAFYVQNTDNDNAANLTFKFYDTAGNLSCTTTASIPKKATVGYWVPSITCNP